MVLILRCQLRNTAIPKLVAGIKNPGLVCLAIDKNFKTACPSKKLDHKQLKAKKDRLVQIQSFIFYGSGFLLDIPKLYGRWITSN